MSKVGDFLATAAGVPTDRNAMNRNAALQESLVRYRDAQEAEAFYKARIERTNARTADMKQQALSNTVSSLMGLGFSQSDAENYGSMIVAGGKLEDISKGVTEHWLHDQEVKATDPNTPADQRNIIIQGLQGLGRWKLPEVLPNSTTPFAPGFSAPDTLPNPAPKVTNPSGGPQLSDTALAMARYYTIHHGVLPPTMSGFGTAQAKNQLANYMAAHANEPSPADPELDSIYQASLTTHAQQHAVAASATGAFGAGNQARLQSLSNASQHLWALKDLRTGMLQQDSSLVQHAAAMLGLKVTGDPMTFASNYLAQVASGEVNTGIVPTGGGQEERLERQAFLDAAVPGPAFDQTFAAAMTAMHVAMGSQFNRMVGADSGGSDDPEQIAASERRVSHLISQPTRDAFNAAGMPLSFLPPIQDALAPIGKKPANSSKPSTGTAPAAGPSSGAAPSPAADSSSAGAGPSTPAAGATPPVTINVHPPGATPPAQTPPAGGQDPLDAAIAAANALPHVPGPTPVTGVNQ